MEFSPHAKRHARRAASLALPLVSSTLTRGANFREPAHLRGVELKLFARAVAAGGKGARGGSLFTTRIMFFIHRGNAKSTGRQK